MSETAVLTPAENQTEAKPAQTEATQTPAPAAVLTSPIQQTADPKAGQAPAEAGKPAEKKDDPAGKPQGAPEKYQEFKAPEGLTYDAAVTAKWGEIAKTLNLPQEAAQQHLDAMAKTLNESSAARLHQQGEDWAQQTKTHPEFGGVKFDENRAIARKGFEFLATPELQELLKVTRLENNPHVFAAFLKAGKSLSVDGHVGGSPPRAGRARTDAELFYDKVDVPK